MSITYYFLKDLLVFLRSISRGFYCCLLASVIVFAQYQFSTALPIDQNFKVVVQTDHTGPINSILQSDITHQVITASNDNFIRVWSSNPGQNFGRLLHVLQGHTDNITAISMQPDGKNLVSGGRDGRVILWNLFTGEKESEVVVGEKVVALTYSDDPDQNSIAVALEKEKSVHFFDATKKLSEGSVVELTNSTGEISTMLAYNSWRHIACGTTTGEVILLNVNTNIPNNLLKVSSSKILSIGRINDETLVWIDELGSIGTISITQPNAKAEQWKCIQSDKIISASFNSTEKLFSFVTSKGIIEWLDPFTRRHNSRDAQFSTCTMAIESGYMVSGNRSGKLQWITRASMKDVPTPQGTNTILRAVAAGTTSLAMMNHNYDLWVWDYSGGGAVYYSIPDRSGADFHLTYNESGDRLAIGTGSQNSSLYILYLDSLYVLGTNLSSVKGLQFIPGSNFLVSVHSNGSIIVWDILTKQIIRQTKSMLPQVAVSIFGTQLLTADKKTIRFWDVATLRLNDSIVITDRQITECAIDSVTGTIAIGYGNGDIGLFARNAQHSEIKCKGHTGKINQLRWITDDASTSKRILLSCSKDNTIRQWSSDGKPLQSAIIHYTEVWDLEALPNRQFAASVGNDGTCTIFNMHTLMPVIRLLSISPKSWVAVTPDGFFDASSEGIGTVNIVTENHSLPLENYITLLERPNIFAQVLRTDRKAELTILSNIIQKSIPTIRILSPMSVKIFNSDQILLTFELNDASSKIQGIRATNNGTPQYNSEQSPLRGILTLPILLHAGKNLIRVTCITSDGVESYDTTTVFSTKKPPTKPNLYVLGIGISTYKNPQYNLKYAHKDAESMCTTLKENISKSEYNSVIVDLLLDEKATVAAISSSLDNISRSIAPNDRFIFYFAGHGSLITSANQQDYYLITHEIESIGDEKAMVESGLSIHALQSKLLQVLCDKKAIILDACHSGAVTTTFADEQSGSTKVLRQLPRTSGVYMMSAALGSQVARESDKLKHGIFTSVLLEGLGGRAASPEDLQISLSTLQDYVQKRIKKLNTDVYINQTPIFSAVDTDGFIVTQKNN